MVELCVLTTLKDTPTTVIMNRNIHQMMIFRTYGQNRLCLEGTWDFTHHTAVFKLFNNDDIKTKFEELF